VCAVDAEDAHPLLHQSADRGRVLGQAGVGGDHDPHRAVCGRRPEQRLGIPGERLSSFLEVRAQEPLLRRGEPPERPERAAHHPQGCLHVRLGPSERGQAELGQRLLQWAEIVPPERQVVAQVDRPRAVGSGQRLQLGGRRRRPLHLSEQRVQR